MREETAKVGSFRDGHTTIIGSITVKQVDSLKEAIDFLGEDHIVNIINTRLITDAKNSYRASYSGKKGRP